MSSRVPSRARGAMFALAICFACSPEGAGGDGLEARAALEVPLAVSANPSEALELASEARSGPAHEACRGESAELVRAYERQLDLLEQELAREREKRLARESEWLRYTQALGRLGEIASVPLAPFATEGSTPPASSPDVDLAGGRSAGGEGPEEAPAVSARNGDSAAPAAVAVAAEVAPGAPAVDLRAREREIHLALRSLFAVEAVSGLDLLESGALAQDGTAGIGPVVLRVLDPGGRPTGTLCADRLSLEGSRAARTTTLVLERGFERRGGQRTSFLGRGEPDVERASGAELEASLREGERRILLPEVDPAPWIEAVPELFGSSARERVADDGRWDHRALRAALNDLLRVDAAGGYYRVQGFGGVQGPVLHDVMLNQLDREGRLERRLFADRMTVRAGSAGIEILLEDGAQVRGEEKTAFVGGRLRIVLPRAEVAAWTAAGVPGLRPSEVEDPSARAGEAR